jgi:hypothetical protein
MTAAERLHGSPFNGESGKLRGRTLGDGVQIYAVSDER